MQEAILIVKGLEPLSLSLATLLIKDHLRPSIHIDNLNFLEEHKNLLPYAKKFDILNDPVSNFHVPQEDVKYIFIAIGTFLEKIFIDVTDDEIEKIYAINFLNPIRLLRKFYQDYHKPTHLVVIGSCSAWRMQKNQTIYTAIRSAQATFTRNLAPELVRDKPGSKITLVNLGGIKTPEMNGKLFGEDNQFMDHHIVAQMILKKIKEQKEVYQETQIMRKKPIILGSPPLNIDGPSVPEIYHEK
jgi:NADP-dependent 3-hydroxy acid dehydrogenase YdfG